MSQAEALQNTQNSSSQQPKLGVIEEDDEFEEFEVQGTFFLHSSTNIRLERIKGHRGIGG